MIKIWAKTILDNRVKKNIIYQDYLIFNRENFEESIRQICLMLDEPCPVVVSKHFNHFSNFNTTEFKPSDFVESVKFDKLVLENALN